MSGVRAVVAALARGGAIVLGRGGATVQGGAAATVRDRAVATALGRNGRGTPTGRGAPAGRAAVLGRIGSGAVLGLVGLVAVLVPPAGAHGGTLLASVVAGPYRAQVMAAPLVVRGRPPAIDVTVYLSSATSGASITDASVRTTVHADGRTVRPPVRRIAGGYEAIVPVADAFTVGEQTIDVDIAGPRGTGHVRVRPLAPDPGPPVGLLVGTGAVLVLLCGAAVRVRRRRSAGAGRPPGAGRLPRGGGAGGS